MRTANTRSAWVSAQSDQSLPKISSCGQGRLWSDWAKAQTDLSLRRAHRSFYWFWHAAAQILSLRLQRDHISRVKYYAFNGPNPLRQKIKQTKIWIFLPVLSFWHQRRAYTHEQRNIRVFFLQNKKKKRIWENFVGLSLSYCVLC